MHISTNEKSKSKIFTFSFSRGENKMKGEILQEIEIPEGVEVTIEGNTFTVKGDTGENKREFKFHNIDVKKEGNKITLLCKKSTKNEKKMINTNAAHIKNMFKGAKEKFKYLLKIASSHFPMSVELKGNEVIIKNYLGEKVARKAKIPEGVEVKINKDIITVTSSNRELAGQAAANMEKVTKITNRDRRIFQDGIFITNKCGKEI